MQANAEAWKLWSHITTQWRVGFSGITGLDYNALYLVAGTLGITMTETMLGKIQAIERAELTESARRRKKDYGEDAED